MNITSLNNKLNSLNEGRDNDFAQTYAWSLVNALDGANNRSKSIEDLHPMEAANLIQYQLSPSSMDIPEEYRGYYEHFSNKFASEDLWTVLPSNDEYYFLSAIKRELPENQNQIFRLAADYNISSSALSEFKDSLKLDWLTSEDHQNIIRLKEDGILDESIVQNLEERGFINQLSTNEKDFLKLIDSKSLNINTDEFEYLYKKYDISPSRISKLVAKNAHLDILATNESDWLKDGAKVENLGSFELSESDYWKLKHRINYYSKSEIRSIDTTNLNPDEIAYISAIKDGKTSPELKELNKTLNLDKETLFLINKRIEHYNGDEIKDINYNTIIDLKTKYRFKPHVRYFEPKELVQERSKRPVSYELKSHISDSYLLISNHHSLTNEFNRNDFERMSELNAHNKTIDDAIVPSNQELAFLENIKWRKLKKSTSKIKKNEILQKKEELLKKIANDDFNIDENQFNNLLDSGFINIYLDGDKRPSTAWREPKPLTDARIYLTTKNKLKMPESSIILKHLQIDAPNNNLLSLLTEDKLLPPPFKQRTLDYEMALKTFREDPLSSYEKARLSELRRNGIHPESLEYKRWLYQDCKSRKMHFAQERAFKNNYKKKYGVNLEALKFVNSFKQISHKSLLNLGLSEEEILRYSEGIATDNGNPSGRQRLLNKSILPNPRQDITYYYINHKGIVSGRSFLKEIMKKSEINSRPQQRQDLLFHDLKVPDCVLKTQEMYEKKGWILKEIKNESAQYSDIKKGTQNSDRKNGPAFMDAQLVFTRLEADNSTNSPTKGKTSIVVGVEYGNYVNERMASKIENSIYDEAHVFSNERHMKKYQKQITTARVVTFHKI